MNARLTTAALVAGMIVSGHALASPLLWQGNSLSYLYGKDFKMDAGEIQQTITYEHVSGWTWGDVFLFVDYKMFNGLEGNEGETYYGEFSPRLSFGKLSGTDLSAGPIKDLLLAFTYERGESMADGTPNQNYLLGPSVDLSIPGFDRFALSAYYRKPDGATGKKAGQWQLTPTWAITLPVGSSNILIDGYIDWVVNEKTETFQTSHFHFNPQIKYDLGKALGYGASQLYVGVEYDYWSNKYGLEDGAIFDSNQNTASLMLKAHF